MKIISLNVNQFLGKGCPQGISKENRLRINEKILSLENKNKLYDYLEQNTNNLIFLHEFPSGKLRTSITDEFLKELKEKYTVFVPKNEKANFMTIAITKSDNWEIDTEIYNYNESCGLFLNRFLPLKNGNLYVTGIHIPAIDIIKDGKIAPNKEEAIDFWNDVIKYFKPTKNHILIGDFNVDADGTRQKNKYNILCQIARDVWLEYGSGDGNTFVGNTRVDYAFASKNIKLENMRNIKSVLDFCLSDHCAIELIV